jgi:hypothetical protein
VKTTEKRSSSTGRLSTKGEAGNSASTSGTVRRIVGIAKPKASASALPLAI